MNDDEKEDLYQEIVETLGDHDVVITDELYAKICGWILWAVAASGFPHTVDSFESLAACKERAEAQHGRGLLDGKNVPVTWYCLPTGQAAR